MKHLVSNIWHQTPNTPAIGMERLLELFCWSLSLSKGNKKRLARARPVTLVEGIALITIHKKTPTSVGVDNLY